MRVDLPEDRPRLSVVLSDGASVTLSPLQHEDKDLLEDGLANLSVESRFTRFGGGVGHLTDRELDYLSDVDQRTHVAWGASIGDDSAAVGRYICLEESGVAEIAVTVLDEYQNRGLGTLLFQALAAVARNDGVRTFRFEMVRGNRAMESMTAGVDARFDETEGLVIGDVPVSEVPVHGQSEEMVAVMEATRKMMDA